MAIGFVPDHIWINAILLGAVNTKMLRDGLARGHAGDGSLHKRLENCQVK